MVFGDAASNIVAPLGNRIFVPVTSDGHVKVVEIGFDGSQGAALFGNKDKLLNEWRNRLGFD
jgi:hypothetical protein